MSNNTIVTTGLVLMGAFTGVLIALAIIGKDIRAREKKCFPIVLVGHDHIDCLGDSIPRHISNCRACKQQRR